MSITHLQIVGRVALAALVLLPYAAGALTLSGSIGFSNFQTFVTYVIDTILGPIIPLTISAAVIYLLIGIVKYTQSAADAAKREEGRKMIIMGVIAIAVMLTFWGFAKILTASFGFQA